MVSETRLIPVLSGTTASGKTALALELARSRPIEIINADSLLVYRGMDIGTAKPSPEERARIPHHLIDIRDPSEPYTAGDFVQDAKKTSEEIRARGALPLVVGGTGFYLKALIRGLWNAPKADPEIRRAVEALDSDALYEELRRMDGRSALRIGKNDRYRLVRAVEILRQTGKTPSQLEAEREQAQPKDPPSFKLLVIDRPQEELRQRISERTRKMLAAGWIEEVRELLRGFPGALPLKSVGYRQIAAFLQGRHPTGRKPVHTIEDLAHEIELATQQLVKRQRTWFRAVQEAELFELDRDRDKLLQTILK